MKSSQNFALDKTNIQKKNGTYLTNLEQNIEICNFWISQFPNLLIHEPFNFKFRVEI